MLALLFTGHRLDAPGRSRPRFPPAAEPRARRMIREAVERELAAGGGPVEGLAGGASGGDILFHEVCAELGIPTRLYLALPRDDYVRASVADAGAEWVERFDRLLASLPVQILGPDEEAGQGRSVWQRNNLWTLDEAIRLGTAGMTLIALWNGEGGDGPGGTEDMVARARERGDRVVILDAGELLA